MKVIKTSVLLELTNTTQQEDSNWQCWKYMSCCLVWQGTSWIWIVYL